MAKTLAELPQLILMREAQYASSFGFSLVHAESRGLSVSVVSGMKQHKNTMTLLMIKQKSLRTG